MPPRPRPSTRELGRRSPPWQRVVERRRRCRRGARSLWPAGQDALDAAGDDWNALLGALALRTGSGGQEPAVDLGADSLVRGVLSAGAHVAFGVGSALGGGGACLELYGCRALIVPVPLTAFLAAFLPVFLALALGLCFLSVGGCAKHPGGERARQQAEHSSSLESLIQRPCQGIERGVGACGGRDAGDGHDDPLLSYRPPGLSGGCDERRGGDRA